MMKKTVFLTRFACLSAALIGSVALLSGCQTSPTSRVVLPSTPPLSAEVLEQTVSTCGKDIERIKGRAPYVPDERKKEFEAVVNLAQKDCSFLQDALVRLKGATHREQSLRQNIQHAEATMLPGTVVTESSSGKEDHSSKPSGEISMEPLR